MDFQTSLAIVGNGPSERTSQGVLIDGYEKVARFNNFKLGTTFSELYGSKTSYWVCSFYPDIQPRKDSFERVFCPLPINQGRWKSRFRVNRELLASYRSVLEVIPEDYYIELLRYIPNPSTGMCFLFWVYKSRGFLRSEDLFGFTFFDQSKAHHYFDSDSRCEHNGLLESIFFWELVNGKV